ncbi:uncharacterized protein LOC113648052 isoform X1 [Tachysurus ichikawai]
MSSYAIMNEHWMVVSWVMVQSEKEKSLEPMYQGLAHRYRQHHALYSYFAKFLSAAFCVVDQEDMQKNAYAIKECLCILWDSACQPHQATHSGTLQNKDSSPGRTSQEG